jgi:ribosomal protein L40E
MANAEQIPNNPSPLVCPKCAALRPESAATCQHCGVIFAKIRTSSADAPSCGMNTMPEPPVFAGEPEFPAVRYMRVAFLSALAFYTFRLLSHSIASNYVGETFLHLVNLPFHEAGHVFFSPFGRFLQVAGGTIMQLLVPAVVATSFFLRRDRYGAAVALWWFGESIADVAPYADDASAGQLPLLGGVTGSEVKDYHDWEVMLSRLGLLSWDHAIGRFFFVTGGLVMAAALAWGLAAAFRRRGQEQTLAREG